MKKKILMITFSLVTTWAICQPAQNESPKRTDGKKSQSSCDNYGAFKKKQQAQNAKQRDHDKNIKK